MAARKTKSRLTQTLSREVEYAVHLLICPAVASWPVCLRNEIPLITTVSDVSSPDSVANGLWQGLAFSATIICKYFVPKLVPGAKGR